MARTRKGANVSIQRTSPPAGWQLQDAKARFSEVFRLALTYGPQRITRHGKDAAVLLSAAQFEQLTGAGKQPRSLVKFFAESPLAHSGIQLDRKPDFRRKIDL